MTLPRQTLRLALVLALPALTAIGGAACAQSPWPTNPAPAGTSPSPFDQPARGAAPSPFEQPPQQQVPPCMNEFLPLRDAAAKKAAAIGEASKRHATPQEACGLFNSFVAAESKVLKYAEANAASCGIPPQAIREMKTGHNQAIQIRAKVCQAAKMQQQGPAGPSLGDALGTSQVPNASNVKPGHGTFDTLTGTPLGNTK
jgi:hypothetical protein